MIGPSAELTNLSLSATTGTRVVIMWHIRPKNPLLHILRLSVDSSETYEADKLRKRDKTSRLGLVYITATTELQNTAGTLRSYNIKIYAYALLF